LSPTQHWSADTASRDASVRRLMPFRPGLRIIATQLITATTAPEEVERADRLKRRLMVEVGPANFVG